MDNQNGIILINKNKNITSYKTISKIKKNKMVKKAKEANDYLDRSSIKYNKKRP